MAQKYARIFSILCKIHEKKNYSVLMKAIFKNVWNLEYYLVYVKNCQDKYVEV